MSSWTFNFESDDKLFLQRIRQFVTLLLRTKEMDQFLRAYKIFFANNSKKQYNALLDVLLQKYNIQAGQYMNSGSGNTSAPEKKNIFKHLKSIDEQRNALIVLVLIFSSLFQGVDAITNQIRDSAKDWYRAQIDQRKDPTERQILERKYDTENKKLEEQIKEVLYLLRQFFMKKIEKNLVMVQEAKQIQTVR
jgi:hypothetical protein